MGLKPMKRIMKGKQRLGVGGRWASLKFATSFYLPAAQLNYVSAYLKYPRAERHHEKCSCNPSPGPIFLSIARPCNNHIRKTESGDFRFTGAAGSVVVVLKRVRGEGWSPSRFSRKKVPLWTLEVLKRTNPPIYCYKCGGGMGNYNDLKVTTNHLRRT